MKLVIDIDEIFYERAKQGDLVAYNPIIHAIKNGIVLPSKHGRLIDADALINTLGCSDRDIYCQATIEEDAKVIVEASE